MPRLVVANLDFESQLAKSHCPGPHKTLPARVLRRIAEASQRLGVFCKEGDRLWTLAPIPKESCTISTPAISGPIKFEDYSDALFWGELGPSFFERLPLPSKATWQEALWHLHPTAHAIPIANDRRFSIPLRKTLDSLPYLGVISSIEELDETIASSQLPPSQGWVVKAPFSAAARDRLRRHGPLTSVDERAYLQGLLKRFGSLVMESWVPRIDDFGLCGVIAANAKDSFLFPPHQLLVDSTGGLKGIRVSDVNVSELLGQPFCEAMHMAATRAASSLRDIGYLGPFGVDGFRFTQEDGSPGLQEIGFHEICEINARLTFGHVVRAHAERSGSDDFVMRF